INLVKTSLNEFQESAGRTEVLVLGTIHLKEVGEQLQSSHLTSLLAELAKFKPDRIVVECLPPETLEYLGSRATGHPFHKKEFARFGHAKLQFAAIMQAKLKLTSEDARNRAEARLKLREPAVPERIQLIAELIAGIDWPTAVLHWSWLNDQQRATAPLPAEIITALNDAVRSPEEVYTIAVPLARSLGLVRLDSMDAHSDGLQILGWPEAKLKAVFGHPLKSGIMKSEIYRLGKEKEDAALKAGSLLPYYQWLNSPTYQIGDATAQWGAHLKMEGTDGYGKARFALWEMRNLHMAGNIAAITARPGVERVLVIVGAAHKPFLDAQLASLSHIKLLHLHNLTSTKK
ncbi:MAG: DUF5694 domain-containing protein, partial [Pseudobdellovibrionaceae bacterium]|nr:DUF5694 domain-containing protein [Pseudobdellovibrionaceae bacterium]